MPRVTEKMKAPDAAWLRMERPVNPMTITGVMMTAAPMPRETLLRLTEERLLVYRRFRMGIEGADTSSPRWALEEPFDLGRRIVPLELPAPGDQDALEAAVSALMSEPLAFETAPWTMHHVERYGEGSALIVRLHHCIGDGIALMHVLLSLSDELWDPSAIRPSPVAPERSLGARLARGGQRVGTAVGHALTRPKVLGRGLVAAGKAVAALVRLLALQPDPKTRLKNGVSTMKRAAWTRPIPLDTIKAVGRATGAKVNDVLLAAAAGGLRRYLAGRGEPTDGVEIRAAVPFNVRPLDRAHELGNAFALVFLTLPVGMTDPARRLQTLKERMDRIKHSAEPAVVYAILQTIGLAPGWLHRFVVWLFSMKCSAVMTNVPGPAERLHLMGVPLADLMFWVPQAGDLGLGLSILSYDGRVLVGVAADARVVEDPNALAAAFEEEFDALASRYAGEDRKLEVRS